MWNIEKIVKKGDYLYAVVPEHPKAIKYGYVLLHRVIMENHLKRLLNNNEVVHHKNEDKKDNRIENLKVLTNEKHSYGHKLNIGRKYLKLKCPSCHKIFDRPENTTHVIKKCIFTACSNSCRGKFSREIQLYGRTHAVESAISENIVSKYTKYLNDNAEETQTRGSVETIRIQAETPKT